MVPPYMKQIRRYAVINFKDFINSQFPTHEVAMNVLGISKTSFYRRLKDDSWVVFPVKKSKSNTVFYIAKIASTLNTHVE